MTGEAFQPRRLTDHWGPAGSNQRYTGVGAMILEQAMADYLLSADWKKVIGSSSSADTASLTKRLDKYAQIKGKSDPEDEVVALQEITELALSLKKKLAKDAKVVTHLDKMAREAQETKKKVEAEAEKEEAEAAKAGKDVVLLKMLRTAKSLSPEKPYYFALALGTLSGLVIAKMVSTSSKEKARDARTRNNGRKVGGKLLLGRCYGEDGKVVLHLGIKPEDSTKPPPGLAANVKKSIKKQTQGASKTKVLVRGGGHDLDEDTDTGDLTDFGPEEHEPEQDQAQGHGDGKPVTESSGGHEQGTTEPGEGEDESTHADAGAFKERFAKLKTLCEELKTSNPALARQIAGLLMQAGSLAKTRDFEGASLRLDEGESLARAASTDTPGDAPTSGSDGELEALYEARLAALEPGYRRCLEQVLGETSKMSTLIDFADGKADAGDLTAALKTLKTLEDLITAALANVAPEAPLEVWTRARELAVGRLRDLIKAIQKSRDPKAGLVEPLLLAIIKNLTPRPETLQSVLELERYISTDEIISTAETPNRFRIPIELREPLLEALKPMKAHFKG